MTDLPYTDDDLRAEAARQHRNLTDDPDCMGVGEQMLGTDIPSTVPLAPETDDSPGIGGTTWDEALDEGQFITAQDLIHDLVTEAADTSAWAVNLGADGLAPHDSALTLSTADDKPYARMHFAFSAAMTDAEKDRFVVAVARTLADLT